MPVLMILGTNQYGSTINTSLYSVTKRKIILELSFPNDDERCCGSSHGWLVFQRSDDIIYLFNPFSGETIHLPSLSYHVDKVVLSKNPSTNPYDVEVVAIVQCGFVPLGLAILRPGSNEWIVMTHGMSRHVVCDVIYYDDRYYVVTSHGRVLSIDKMTLDLNEISGPAPVRYSDDFDTKFHLIKTTTNELLMIHMSNPNHIFIIKCEDLQVSSKPYDPRIHVCRVGRLG
ncbi:hypothetical protein P3S68_002552 [Capsicum galapagoense]